MTATVDEGESRTYSFTVSDPGADTFVLGATVCGSGGNQVGADTFNPATGAGSFVCEFPDGPATPTVSVTVSDDDGGSDSDTVDVIVGNVAPIVTLTGDATVDEGESRTYSFTVSDPGRTRSSSARPSAAAAATRSAPTRSTRPPAPAASSAIPRRPGHADRQRDRQRRRRRVRQRHGRRHRQPTSPRPSP